MEFGLQQKCIREKFNRITQNVVSFLEKTSYPKQLTQSYLHGDIGLEHVQLLPNNHLYFFDWADRVDGPVARELSILLFHSYGEEDISFERWEQLKKWILESYSSINQLSKDDTNVIVPFLFRRCIDEVRYLADLATQKRKPIEVKAIARRFDLADKLLINLN